MRLKRLTLQGYKTFASRSVFEFESGITAIVGPNGSGKSNVADALRWVLGEQSYSMLRGKRTVDMIFAGSQNRSRAGMAQATIALDNSDQSLPIEFSELEIARRAYRSGENEYLLNGQKVRLRDVTELLATSGLAERTYTIIGQGLIDQALSLRSDERRLLFEEAAGVSLYQNRRAETLRKLDETERNVERILDIMHEISPRLRSLRRQSTQARNYEQVAKDLHHHLRIWYGFQWERAAQAIQEGKTRVENVRVNWQDIRSELTDRQQELTMVREQIAELENSYESKEVDREVIRGELEVSRRRAAVLAERKAIFSQQLDEIESELPNLQELRRNAAKDLDEAISDLDKAQARLEEVTTTKLEFERGVQSELHKARTLKESIEELENERREVQQRTALYKGQIRQLESQLERLEEKASAEDEGGQEAVELDSMQEQLTTLRDQTHEVSENRKDKVTKLKRIEEMLESISATYAELEEKQGQIREELTRNQTRFNFLVEMLGESTADTGADNSYGQLHNSLTIPSEFRTAVGAALGHRISTWLFEEQDEIWRFLDITDRRPLTAALARSEKLEFMDEPDHEKVIGWANKLVQASPPFDTLADRLLRRTLVVTDSDSALELARQLPVGYSTVTLEGVLVDRDGIVEAGLADSEKTTMIRIEERKKTQRAVDKLKSELEETKERRSILDDKRSRNQKARLDLLEGIASDDRALEKLAAEIANVEKESELQAQQRRFLAQKREDRLADAERLADRIHSLLKELDEAGRKMTDIEDEWQSSRDMLADLSVVDAEEHLHNLSQRLESARTIVAGRQAVVDSRRATLNQLDSRLNAIHERKQRILDENRKLETEGETLKIDDLERAMKELEDELAPLRMKAKEKGGQARALELTVDGLQDTSQEREEQLTAERIDLAQRENSLDALRERISADLGLVYLATDDEYSQSPLPIDDVVDNLPKVEEVPEDIEESISRYRSQLTRFGAVNPNAPLEYKELEERYSFLDKQVEDLRETKDQLKRIIDELDELTSTAFARTVQEVDALFGNTFTRLFGGGTAQLVLTEPDELTVSGVEIVARLPGRREQGLALMSGGERSLVAAALIFALLSVSPPPFCVLDEVDAMLDEANIDRFRTLLQELTEQTQFIVITHNRGTVQAAERVYGISMGADSTSQVISIKPEEFVR